MNNNFIKSLKVYLNFKRFKWFLIAIGTLIVLILTSIDDLALLFDGLPHPEISNLFFILEISLFCLLIFSIHVLEQRKSGFKLIQSLIYSLLFTIFELLLFNVICYSIISSIGGFYFIDESFVTLGNIKIDLNRIRFVLVITTPLIVGDVIMNSLIFKETEKQMKKLEEKITKVEERLNERIENLESFLEKSKEKDNEFNDYIQKTRELDSE